VDAILPEILASLQHPPNLVVEAPMAAGKRFFSKAMKMHGTPRVITLNAYAASHRAITEL
jgi:hypothetical protein